MEKKIFDDFPKVDCNDCEHWWDSSCDGVYKGTERQCKTFKATRGINIPSEVKRVKNDLRRLQITYYILVGLFMLQLVAYIIWR